jgi:quaternary ammonium compound-resistance protein SugE
MSSPISSQLSWLLVLVSGLLEVGWALGLKASAGLTRPLPTALTIAGMLASFALLSIAVRHLPIGTAYAVWVGIGAVGTALLGIAIHGEPASAVRLACLALIVAGIVGLKATSGGPPAAPGPRSTLPGRS